MNTLFKKTRNDRKVFVNILVIFVILTMALPAAGGASAQELSPFIVANPTDDFVHANEWPIGTDVSLEIDDPTNGVGVDFTGTSTSVASWWIGPPTVAIFDLKGVFDLQPGHMITMAGAGTTKYYTVTDFMIANVDVAANMISGMATPGANIQVCSDNMSGTCRTTAADLNGYWSAPADPNTFALQQGADGWAAEYENDKDQTFARWYVPAPKIFANPVDNTVGARGMPEGTELTMSINEGAYSSSAIAGPAPYNPNDIIATFPMNDFDVQPGQVITVEGGGASMTYTVTGYNITSVDLEADTVSGQGTPGARLQICANLPDRCVLRYPVADSAGNWVANFGQAGPRPDEQELFDIQNGSNGWGNESDKFYNQTWTGWSAPPPPPVPYIAVSLTINWISLTNFLPNTLATISIYEAQGSGTPAAELSRNTDASGNLYINGWEINWDPEPGNFVVATDGVTTKELLLEYLTLDVFDPANDIVSGRALPGRKVDVGAGNADGEQWMTVYADDSGLWTADYTTIKFDLTEDMWAGGHVGDEDGDVTAAHNSGPPPTNFTAFPEWETIEGGNWPVGATVHLSIDDPATEASPDFEQDQTVIVAPWDPNSSWVTFNFANEYDLKPGDIVTLTSGAIARTHTVRNLSIKKVYLEGDKIKGMADAGAEVYVWPHATGQQQLAVATADGIWKVDFSGIFDLVPGEAGRSEIRDEFGNSTAVDWYIPYPGFTVFPEWDWFDGINWPDGEKVTITVAGKPQCKLKMESWNYFFNGGFPAGCDVVIGDTVTFAHGNTIRTHVVQNLSITDIDAEANTIAGKANPGAEIYVWPHAIGQQLQVTADDMGAWQVDFSDVFDLVPGECGRSEIRDGAGNATAVDWCVPWPPRLVVQITEDWFRAENFLPDTALNFWIYDAPGGNLLASATTPPTDENGTVSHWVGEAVDVVPGHYLVVTDNVTTKEIVLETLTFDVFDTSLGILQGTAPEPFGRAISVGIGCWELQDWWMDVTTNENGTWIADFGKPVPDSYGCVYAWAYDQDGDVSEVRPSPRTVDIGNFYVAWDQTNPEEVVYLSWKESGNLTPAWHHTACPGDLEFFGNSWVSESEGNDLFFFASLVGWGTTGTWSGETGTQINIGSISSGCPGSANIPVNTQYQFFDDELRANLIKVERTFDFGDSPYAHDIRPFIPRLNPSDGFTQVLHPDESGTILLTDGTCDFGCIAASWDGSWFAIHNPDTGMGMIVQHLPSTNPVALWLDDDDGSFTNSSAVLLLQPAEGFLGSVTETEYLCFYDNTTWSPSLDLPPGCQP